MLNWKDYRKQVKGRVSNLSSLVPEVMKAYSDLATSDEKLEPLGAKTREMMALAVTTRRDGCIASHVETAIAHGAIKEELAEALGVAIALQAQP